MEKKSKELTLALLCVGVLATGFLVSRMLSSDENRQKPPLAVLTIGTADSGGTMYPVGRAIAEAIEAGISSIKVNTSASNGSFTNVEGLRSGQIDLGLVSGDVAHCAYNGTELFAGRPAQDLRAIGAVYTSLSQWIVLESSGVTRVQQLRGRRVALGPEDSTTELSAHTALSVLGIDDSNTNFENYGLGSGGDALLEDKIDAVHGFAGIPISGMQTLAERYPCRILGYEDDPLEEILNQNPAYARVTIPAGTYPGQKMPVDTFGVKCLLTVRADMDEELVYAITSILHQSASQLAEIHSSTAEMQEEGFLYEGLSVPLHPGAERYYQEQGLL